MKNPKFGKERIYSDEIEGKDDVIKVDVLKINKVQKIRLKFIKSKAKYPQGISVSIQSGKGKVILEDGRSDKGAFLWASRYPSKTEFVVESPEGLLTIENAYEETDHWSGSTQYRVGMFKSGMLIKQKGNKFIYHCHDVGEPVRFDNLVFSLELLDKEDQNDK